MAHKVPPSDETAARGHRADAGPAGAGLTLGHGRSPGDPFADFWKCLRHGYPACHSCQPIHSTQSASTRLRLRAAIRHRTAAP
ncbi:hypothetical protein FRACA_80009 [Frankia canadensis]|uniref:Uncharacterized protein n=1 Tax=Frankia canadensis TaxID=1836972 RepID=A0A2I2L1D1_9ACTN|nr:hypothetical protein FRACA_80009 [Frankia canadensis]SOU58999.1 hypothetical protein FRACA_80009 [Frankia canadensis]